MWPAPNPGESEPEYTGRLIGPAVLEWVRSLKNGHVVVRSDGLVPPLPVYVLGMFFRPDVEIASHASRMIAIEVKFIRDSDPSGSVSKAIGQALIYRASGIHVVHVLLLDARRSVVEISPEISRTDFADIRVHHRQVVPMSAEG